MILFIAWRERVCADMVKAIASIKIITFTHYGANSFYGRSDPTTGRKDKLFCRNRAAAPKSKCRRDRWSTRQLKILRYEHGSESVSQLMSQSVSEEKSVLLR